MRISDWNSDVCSSHLSLCDGGTGRQCFFELIRGKTGNLNDWASLRRSTRSRLFKELSLPVAAIGRMQPTGPWRSEEHTSELQSLMRISYAVFCLKKKHCNPQAKSYINYYTTKHYYASHKYTI